jgi:hypothetical protein
MGVAILGSILCSQRCATLCAYCECVTINIKVWYLYIYWRDIQCRMRPVRMVFVCAKVNVAVCLVVFMASLV